MGTTRSLCGVAAMALVISIGAPAETADRQDAAGTANPELVGAVAKELATTPKQAEGAAGALFGLAKSKLKPDDWTKVAAAVPGMDGLLKAAPAAAAAGVPIPGVSGLGGLAAVAGAFSKLNLKPELAAKVVPVLTSFVTKSGGADVGKLLAGALK